MRAAPLHPVRIDPEATLLFELPGGGRALFTDRSDGNMSSVGSFAHEHGACARARTRARRRLSSIVHVHQVHGATVLRIRAEDDLERHEHALSQPSVQVDVQADGLATPLTQVGVMVLAADCLPIALGDGRAVAVVHAGWRGLAAGVIEAGVRALRELGDGGDPDGCSGSEEERPAVYGEAHATEGAGERDGAGSGIGRIAAIVGPGAGPCCYEVGDEVRAAFAGAHCHDRRIDLKAIARDRLLAAGVAEVRDVGACTICDERFFSHRREASAAGRQAGIAWLSG